LFFDVSCLGMKSINLIPNKSKIVGGNTFLQKNGQDNSNKTMNHSYAILDDCNSLNCEFNHGRCISNNVCRCKKAFAEVPANNDDGMACQYIRKKQMVAFLLEFFVPFGSSHFYLGNKELGMIKVGILFFVPLMFVFICCDCFRQNDRPVISKAFMYDKLGVIYLIGLLMWMFFDVLNIALDRYTDVNEVKMEPW
jgi:hypothetical protein